MPPALVILTMVAVGQCLTVGDFRRVASKPGLVAAASVGQLVCLPLIALVLVRSLGLSPAVEKGMLLVAACPAGSMANLYGQLAKANVALSVSLTAVSCLAALVTMPALMMGFQAYLGGTAAFVVPIPAIIGQLLLTLIFPILTGPANRRARLAAELLASDAYGSIEARAAAFVAQGGGCRATFFNYRRKVQ